MSTNLPQPREWRVCARCRELYFYCPHHGDNYPVQFEEARTVAANMMLRLKFSGAHYSETATRNLHEVFGGIHEVFGVSEVT